MIQSTEDFLFNFVYEKALKSKEKRDAGGADILRRPVVVCSASDSIAHNLNKRTAAKQNHHSENCNTTNGNLLKCSLTAAITQSVHLQSHLAAQRFRKNLGSNPSFLH